jgi:hypothetical protein
MGETLVGDARWMRTRDLCRTAVIFWKSQSSQIDILRNGMAVGRTCGRSYHSVSELD